MSLKKPDILNFIKSSPVPVTKREIARAFGIKGGENRVALKQILKSLEIEEAVTKQPGGAYSVPEGLPGVTTLEVTEIDIDGDVFARPAKWNEAEQGPPPRIEIMPDKKGHPSLAVGDRVLARLWREDDGSYEAKTIRKLDGPEGRVIGLVRLTKSGGRLEPSDKKTRFDYIIDAGDLNGAKEGDLAIGEVQPARGARDKNVRIVEIIGSQGDPKAISIISLYEAGLREEFPAAVIKETEKMKVPALGKREDLRAIPLVTIDGADARDFDDAVWAEKQDDGGYHIIVAIADVSYYVRPETALDREAQRRGNSTYFPDRVVPMLPEALSNDLCSLRPNEPRACLAAHLWIDKNGKLLRHKFVRGLMRSAARLIYEDVQKAFEAQDHELISVINPLYDAFRILDAARQERGALDLDLPERQIIIDKNGNMTGVRQRERFDSHKLIEEFMILANVAAAQAIEAKVPKTQIPCVYRVHDRPSAEKLESLRDFLESFENLTLPKGNVVKPAGLNHLLRKAANEPYSHLISTVVLRSQSQAVYSSENLGHFGLALSKYAHFTSPIRRYADLLVHRALVSDYGLGEGGITEGEIARLPEICQHISQTERTSMEAERNAVDRFTAAYLSDKIGQEFRGRISGVTRFGLFVTLAESGADGLISMKSMGDDFYVHDERAHALVGRRHGKIYQLGADVTVRLEEADGLTGSTLLSLARSRDGAAMAGARKPRIRQGDMERKGRKGGKKPGHAPARRGKSGKGRGKARHRK